MRGAYAITPRSLKLPYLGVVTYAPAEQSSFPRRTAVCGRRWNAAPTKMRLSHNTCAVTGGPRPVAARFCNCIKRLIGKGFASLSDGGIFETQ